MEVFRHARRRSRFHALSREERAMEKADQRTISHAPKKARMYRDIDNEWARERHRAASPDDQEKTEPADRNGAKQRMPPEEELTTEEPS